jgi:hypothetical protein
MAPDPARPTPKERNDVLSSLQHWSDVPWSAEPQLTRLKPWHPTPKNSVEVAPETWKDFLFDIAQQTEADKVGRSKRPAPRPRRWFIEAYDEAYDGVELVLAVRAGVGEPTYFGSVLIGTGIECGRFILAEPTDALDAHNGHKQVPMLVADVKPVEDGKFVVRWLWSLVRLHLIEDFPSSFETPGLIWTRVRP